MEDPFLERIDKRLKELGISAAAASRAAGGSKDLIRGLYRNKGQRPQGRMLSGLATALQVSEVWLLHGDTASAQAAGLLPVETKAKPPRASAAPPSVAIMPLDVPVFGTASGSILGSGQGAWEMTPDPVDYVRRAPGLAAARDAYALYVENESMEPRFPPGELVIVHPGRPVRSGDAVVVQVQTANHTPIETFIKIMVGRTKRDLICRQYNPEAEIHFRAKTVLSIHRVLSMAEVLGA